jgi:hypothetical protein
MLENNTERPVITREHSPEEEQGRITLEIDGYVLVDARPDDYRPTNVTAEQMERIGALVGTQIMNRFNSSSAMKTMLGLISAPAGFALPERTDVFGLRQEEIRFREIDPSVTKKIARFLLGHIHNRLKDPSNLADFADRLNKRLARVREHEAKTKLGQAQGSAN